MKKNLETIKWLYSKIKNFLPIVILITLIGMTYSIVSVRASVLTRNVIDAAVGKSDKDFMTMLLLMAGVIIFQVVLNLLDRHLSEITSFKMDWFWKKYIMHELLYDDYQRVSAYHSGRLLYRINADVRTVINGSISFLPGLIAIITKLITAIVTMSEMDPGLTVVMVVGGICIVISSFFLRSKIKGYYMKEREASAAVSAFLQENIENLQTVQALDVASEVENREEGLLKERWKWQIKRKNGTLITSTGISCVSFVTEAFVLIWSVLELRSGKISFGTMTAILQLFNKLESPFISFTGLVPRFIALTGSTERVREICELRDKDEIPGDQIQAVDADKVYGDMKSIEGRGIWFKYADAHEDEYAIKDVDFSIPKGSFATIVGHSGIGKSTLLKIMLGICTAEKGEMYVEQNDDGKLVIDRATRSLFAYVPQGNILMSGTMKENLLLTCPDATDEQLRAAIETADLAEFIDELPKGWNTKLGENALGISEGQAQRVSIARALLSGKPIILLDEATSSLDEATEQRVLEKLRQLPGKTIIAVTHRPAAREMSDCVIEL